MKLFSAFVIFLVSVSVAAQQGGAELSNDASEQVLSKEIVTDDSAVDQGETELLNNDSSVQISSQIDSAEQSGGNDVNDADGVITLKISTDPSEAGLRIGNRDYGVTPVIITDLDVGEHILELSKRGHFRRRVTIQLDSTGADLHFELLRPASVFITSEPQGAQISFHNEQSGITPFQSERIRPGDYPLTISMDGYKPYETTVNLKSGAADTLHITLKSLEPEIIIPPESQIAQIQQISQPEKTKKSLFNKEHTRTGIAAIAFFAFIAILIGVEKTSY